jgi:hypothetical protein
MYQIKNFIKPPQSSIIFLSYSRKDTGIIRKMEMIVRATGSIPWRDENSIAPGNNWRKTITDNIEDCDRMLVFWCRHSESSQEVKKEYQQAIRINKTVVPVC